MLIEKPVSTNDVACLKLSNGDEMIARVAEINEQSVVVSKPMLMVLTQDPRSGQPGVNMLPFWMVGGDRDTKYPVARHHVVCMIKANPDAAKGYLAQTTGLAMPGSAGGIIT